MDIKRNLAFSLMAILFFFSVSCSEREFLKEMPLDVYTLPNSFKSPDDIEMVITDLYKGTLIVYDGSEKNNYMFIGTDACMAPRNRSDQFKSGGAGSSRITPITQYVDLMWNTMYEIIKNANLILHVIDNINYSSGEEKAKHVAEAKFFRGFAYRNLANLYGNVPIVLDFIEKPKRDYTNAERSEVYAQAAEDLKFATENLPAINEVKAAGRVSKASAYHFLAEVYISLKRWQDAIDASDWVINKSGNFHLMTERFGRRTSVPNTNVFWDLFQRGNIDYQAGNKETIWALQINYGVPGGGSFIPFSAPGNLQHERALGPWYWFAKSPDGSSAFIGPTTQNGGRSGGFVAPTNHVKYDIWEGDWDNDIRNASCNLKRIYIADNPSSPYYGDTVNNFPKGPDTDTLLHIAPYWMKLTTPDDHPIEMINNPATGVVWATAGNTAHNWPMIRLAETYLLMAEAYLGDGNTHKAAEAINVVRSRAGATPVDESKIDIDYILDERLRELMFEEQRRMTLMRLGKWHERTTKYNPWSSPDKVEKFWELLPIPQREFDSNTEGELKQNPGYVN